MVTYHLGCICGGSILEIEAFRGGMTFAEAWVFGMKISPRKSSRLPTVSATSTATEIN